MCYVSPSDQIHEAQSVENLTRLLISIPVFDVKTETDAPVCLGVRYESPDRAQLWNQKVEPVGEYTSEIQLKRSARFVCRVSADPSDSTDFSWYLNNTSGQRRLLSNSRGKVSLADPVSSYSELLFTPSNHLDFGQLECWAKNEIGEQKVACITTIRQLQLPGELH